MSDKEVSVTINGKVVLSADTSRLDQQLRQAGLVGGGAPIPDTAAPSLIGSGAPVPPAGTPSAPTPSPSPNTFGDAAEAARQAARMHMGIDAGLSGARTLAQLQKLEDRLNRADRYGLHSGDQDLVDALKDLRKALEGKRADLGGDASAGGGGGRGGGFGGNGRKLASAGEDSPDSPGFWGRLKATLSSSGGQELGSTAGRAVGGGALGRFAGGEALGALGGIAGDLLGGPVGWVAGGLAAAGAAFSIGDRYITSGNKLARTEVTGDADLARQYGYDRDLMKSFRPDNGWTNQRFASLGYDATEAGRAAAIYDRPGGISTEAERQAMMADPYGSRDNARNATIRERGLLDDTTSILAFSRTTGMNSDRVAGMTRELGMAGIGGNFAGNADDGLRILKYAITEGLKDGIAGSTTMQNLVGFVKGNAAEGRSVSSAGMALFAQLTARLSNAPGGSSVLRGESGASIVQNVMSGIAHPKDAGMEYLMLNAIGDPSAKSLGMVDKKGILTNEGRVYEDVRSSSPLEAGRYLLDRIGSGQNPDLLQKAMAGIDKAFGNNTALRLRGYEQELNLSPQQAAQLIGMGGAQAFASDPSSLQKFVGGQSLNADVQAGNRINNDSLQLSVAERDREMLKSLGNLQTLGNIETTLGEIKNEVSEARKDFTNLLANYGNPDGSLAGQTGGGFIDPRTVPSGQGTGMYTPTAAAAVGAKGGSGPAGMYGGSTGPLFGGSTGPLFGGGTGLQNDGTPLGRTMAAIGMIETNGGTNTHDSSTGAVGRYQIQPQNISRTWTSATGSAGGWDKEYLGADAKNPDGSLVNTTAQASAWLKANPEQANLIAQRVTEQRMGQIRKEWSGQGVKYDDADVAGMAGAWWTAPEGAIRDAHGNMLSPSQLRRTRTANEQRVQTLSPGEYFDKARSLYQQSGAQAGGAGSMGGMPGMGSGSGPFPTQSAEMTRFLAGIGRDLSGGTAVRETQGWGEHKNQMGYGAAGHNGVDFALMGGMGTPVHTEKGGVYRRFTGDPYLGNYAQITGKSGYSLVYGHMTEKDPGIADGTVIPAGGIVGFEGNSGHVMKGMDGKGGVHVHLGARDPKGHDIDPGAALMQWAKAASAGLPGFSSGGWTGSGDPSMTAGVVHHREHVVKAGPAERYRDLLDRMNAGLPLDGGRGGAGGRVQVDFRVSGNVQFAGLGLTEATRNKVEAIWRGFSGELMQAMQSEHVTRSLEGGAR